MTGCTFPMSGDMAQLGRKKFRHMKLLTLRPVDYLEELCHELWNFFQRLDFGALGTKGKVPSSSEILRSMNMNMYF